MSAAVKSDTRDAHVRRIQRAIALIERAIAEGADPPELQALAEAAAFSPFHFHRVYRAMTGETTGQTVQRLRLLRGLRLLGEEGCNVTEAALSVGYQTPQAFARALRQGVGAAPSELREAPMRLRRAIERLARAPLADADAAAPPLRVEVVSVEPFQVVALRVRCGLDPRQAGYAQPYGWAGEHGAVGDAQGWSGAPADGPRDAGAATGHLDGGLALDGAAPAAGEPSLRLLRWGGGGASGTMAEASLARWLPANDESPHQAPFAACQDATPRTPAAALRADPYLPPAQAAA